MRKRFSSLMALFLCLCLLLGLVPALSLAEEAMAAQEGFTLLETGYFGLVNAQTGLYQHDKTGALVLYLANEDNNRAFDISFVTPVPDDSGIPHVFEHATLGGSQKYPSKELFFNLINQTYNTFLNAMTTNVITTYPASSLSEAQLLKYLDYYTDSVLYPSIMEDESIFLEESWRYSLTGKEEPLTLSGTVYTEMQGAYTIDTDAMFNYYKSIFPGSQRGNSFGGHPLHIPQMTWQSLKDYHDDYYHPSNSLTIFYGKFEDVTPFFSLINQAFTDFEKREFAFADADYEPITGPVTANYEFAVEKSSNTDKGAVVYLGYVLDDITQADIEALDLLTTLINSDSSPFQQAMKTRLPSATASSSVDVSKPAVSLMFSAKGLNAQDAPEFESIVKESLALMQKDGMDNNAVEAVAAATRLSLLLSGEIRNAGVNIAMSVAYYWGITGDTNAFARYIDNTGNFVKFAQDGTYQRVIEQYLLNNQKTALVITAPKAGLKEEQAQALAFELEAKKANMTAAEIDVLVEETSQFGTDVSQDAGQYVQKLQAVTVDSLPVERRIYEVSDETGEDQVRRLHAKADVDGVGQALLMLRADAIPMEDVHWFKLYTGLLGKLDTASHSQQELSSLLTRYFYQQEIRPSAVREPQNKGYTPYLRTSFIAMDEDFAPAYDLLYELLFETKLDDAGKIADVLSQIKETLKQTITNGVYQVQIYRAFAESDPAFAYTNYLNYLDYYAFLEQAEELLKNDPEAALQKLAFIQDFLRVKTGAVSAFAGSMDSAPTHRAAADAFLARLREEERERVSYQFPEIKKSEALVVDSAVAYNLMYANNKALGLENTEAALDVITMLVADSFLYPLLRNQYGVYGVDHGATEDGMYLLSFRDPNVKETFDVYAQVPKLLSELEVNQEKLDGSILATFSGYAQSSGELSGALTAFVDVLEGRPQERVLDWMEEIKGLKAEQVKDYVKVYENLLKNGILSTSGGASLIEENKDRYEQVYNPFAVKETVVEGFDDLGEDSPYYEAAMEAVKQKWLTPLSESSFGTEEPATLGEFVSAFFTMAGMPLPPEQGIMALNQMGLMAADAQVDNHFTREGIGQLLYTMMNTLSPGSYTLNPEALDKVADQDQISPENRDGVSYLVDTGLLLLDSEGKALPKETLTRAQFAFLLKGLNEME